MRIHVLVLIAWVVSTAFAAESPIHEQLESQLMEANRLRAARTEAERAWSDTRAKMETLLASIESVTGSTRIAAEADLERARQLQAATTELRRSQEAGAKVHEATIELMEMIHAALDAIAAESIPGLVPENQKAYGELKEQWQQTMSRWKATEDATAAIESRIMIGVLDDRALKVKALLVGTSTGWWLDETSGRAGFLLPPAESGGAVVLTAFPATSSARGELIKAFMVMDGSRAPQWIQLPIQEVGE